MGGGVDEGESRRQWLSVLPVSADLRMTAAAPCPAHGTNGTLPEQEPAPSHGEVGQHCTELLSVVR